MDAFDQLRAGQPGTLDRPVAEPVVIESGWVELERIAERTDQVMAEIDRQVTAMERRYGH